MLLQSPFFEYNYTNDYEMFLHSSFVISPQAKKSNNIQKIEFMIFTQLYKHLLTIILHIYTIAGLGLIYISFLFAVDNQIKNLSF